MHPKDGKALTKGTRVHIPEGFLRGARAGGVVGEIASRYTEGEPEFVQVRWPDDSVTNEYIRDIEFDTPPALSLRERLTLWWSKL